MTRSRSRERRWDSQDDRNTGWQDRRRPQLSAKERAKRYPLWTCNQCGVNANWNCRASCMKCQAQRPTPQVAQREQQQRQDEAKRQQPSVHVGSRPSGRPAPAAQPEKEQGQDEELSRLEARLAYHKAAAAQAKQRNLTDLVEAEEAKAREVQTTLAGRKPVASQIQACFSRRTQRTKEVADLAAKLADLDRQREQVSQDLEEAKAALELQESELQRLQALESPVGLQQAVQVIAGQFSLSAGAMQQILCVVHQVVGQLQGGVSAMPQQNPLQQQPGQQGGPGPPSGTGPPAAPLASQPLLVAPQPEGQAAMVTGGLGVKRSAEEQLTPLDGVEAGLDLTQVESDQPATQRPPGATLSEEQVQAVAAAVGGVLTNLNGSDPMGR